VRGAEVLRFAQDDSVLLMSSWVVVLSLRSFGHPSDGAQDDNAPHFRAGHAFVSWETVISERGFRGQPLSYLAGAGMT
jgi:hypothetical protein